MNKKSLILFVLISFFALSLSMYQYVKEFRSNFVDAYSTVKPANGHLWSEMECSSSLCVTDGKLGIGTDSPTEKLQVGGNIKASGDICNGAGNCLSALATLTNACGGAATTYVYTATAYSGTYCVMGNPTPTSPSFPAQGSSVSWTCPVTNGSPISCTATHAAAPINGVCGAAATTYVYTATAYSGTYCSTGAASPTSPVFPSVGSSTTWSCLGVNGGSSPSCTATRGSVPFLVMSAHTEPECTAAGGTLVASATASLNQCRFNAASCPSGWAPYLSYRTTSATSCASNSCGHGCNIAAYTWGNNTTGQSCTYLQSDVGTSCNTCASTCTYCVNCMNTTITCNATVTQIGCY